MNETAVEPGFEAVELGADASPEVEAEPIEAEAEVVETETAEESEAESPPADDENVEKKTDAFQERIDKLTKSFRESERESDVLRSEVDELRQQLSERPQEPTKTLEDFQYNEDEYRQYLFDEATARAEKVAQKTVQGFQAKQRAETLQDQYRARVKEFSKTVDDFDKVAGAPDLRINADMAREIQESDVGPEMQYYLGSNPDIAASISKLTPREIIKEMSKLEDKVIEEKGKASKKVVSDAPPPPAKVKGSKSPGFKPSTTEPASDKMSDAEWFAAEEKRLAKLRG
jgi:hypothetical protein